MMQFIIVLILFTQNIYCIDSYGELLADALQGQLEISTHVTTSNQEPYYQSILKERSKLQNITQKENMALIGQHWTKAPKADCAPSQPLEFCEYLPCWNPDEGLVCAPFIEGKFTSKIANKGYDNYGKLMPLAQQVFGPTFKLKDIYLASKLASLGKLKLPGIAPSFGNDSNEQYISCLSSTDIVINARIKEQKFVLEYASYGKVPWSQCLFGGFGFTIPIKYRSHKLNLTPEGSFIECGSVNNGQENNIVQYFSDFGVSFFDAFNRLVLVPKGLVLEQNQQKIGVGDIACFGFVDLASYTYSIDTMYGGFKLHFPSGRTRNGNKVWDIEFGKGAWQLELFGAFYYSSPTTTLFNPIIRGGFTYILPHRAIRRVPQLKNQLSNLLIPERFSLHQVLPFSLYDTTVPEFADQALPLRISSTNKLHLVVGNYFADLFGTSFFLTTLYDIKVQGPQSYTVSRSVPDSFDTHILEKNTQQMRQRFTWFVSFFYYDEARLSVGSQHVFSGQNTPKYNGLFGSLRIFI